MSLCRPEPLVWRALKISDSAAKISCAQAKPRNRPTPLLFFEVWLGIGFHCRQFEKIDVTNELDVVAS